MQLDNGGNLSIISTVEGIAQVARQFMQTRRGEMIYDQPNGIPFDIVAFDRAPNIAQFESAARIRLRQVPGVRAVLSFEANMVGDTLDYVTVLETDEGEITVNG